MYDIACGNYFIDIEKIVVFFLKKIVVLHNNCFITQG